MFPQVLIISMHVHAPEERVNRCCISLHKKQQSPKTMQARSSDSHRSALTNTLSVYRANCQNESNKKWRMCLFSALKTLTILLRRCYKHHTLWPPLHLLISSLYLQLNTMKASLYSTASLSLSLSHNHTHFQRTILHGRLFTCRVQRM